MAPVTVSGVAPQTVPVQAVLPAASPQATPELVSSSVRVATVGLEELRTTEASCRAALSLNVPVAMSCWLASLT